MTINGTEGPAFSRSVSLHIARWEKRRVAIVFTDLSDFVAFTERNGDAAAAELALLNQLTAMPIALGHGGHVVKHLGDGALAWFAAPDAAVLAAVDLARRELRRPSHADRRTLG